MRKKKFLSLCVFVPMIVLTGCSHFNNREEVDFQPDSEGKVYNSVKHIACQPLRHPADKKQARIVVNEFTSRLKQSTGETPVLAFSLPPTGSHKVTVNSYVVREGDKQQLFYPAIALLDQSNNIIARIPESQIKYKKPGFTSPESIEAQFVIDNDRRSNEQAVCMLIYTTDELRKGKTGLMNEAKAYAKAYGVVAPPVPDPLAIHGNTGHLAIGIKSSEVALASTAIVPEAATAVALPNAVRDPFTKEVVQHYVDAVNKAFKSCNFGWAIVKRGELGNTFRDTKEYFVEQYGKPVDKLNAPKTPDAVDGYGGEVLYHYQLQIYEHLKAGQGAAALKVIDQIKAALDEVDKLFDY
ncbi:MalM family protein [Endozoicomonas sp. 8E]|uniref:MalM family protein n=1 Tax=Endozoicomonas sp. 8E TaxID=3035692 RepID=UPI0029392C1A|nr:MalM family protein [Endozoicomonas sp. 8E]WOG29111.1 MalM family protein [Endozoicomonas sp. 8E]